MCSSVNLARSNYYRRAPGTQEPKERAPQPRALSAEERSAVLGVLHEERFVDRAPAEVFHTLLAEGQYVASERTMYRILADNAEVKERRKQRRHPVYVRPELMATGPNQVWSWDITRLRTTKKWEYLYLYVVMDIFSRAVVGWMVAETETAALACRLVDETVAREGVRPSTLVLHADRGTQMTSKTLAQLLADLDVTSSHSRPRVSNDNPFSESQFKTLKYHPTFPGKFSTLADARAFGREFFAWYNEEHRHSGIAYLTPNDVHEGRADSELAARHAVMTAAYRANPTRFIGGPPKLMTLSPAVYINPPVPASSPPPSSSSPSKTERSEVGATMTRVTATPPLDSEPWGEGAPGH